jgi:hypothetical protein
MNKKIILIILVLAIVAAGVYFYFSRLTISVKKTDFLAKSIDVLVGGKSYSHKYNDPDTGYSINSNTALEFNSINGDIVVTITKNGRPVQQKSVDVTQ